MQKIFLLVIILLGIGFVFIQYINRQTEAHPIKDTQESTQKEITPTQPKSLYAGTRITQSVFVPYWNIRNMSALSKYDSVIYFGISVNEDGVNKEEQGFANIQSFINTNSVSTNYLTVRMLNTETNLKILEDKQAQQKVIADVISVTKEYGFDGVVLDLELSVIPFTDVKDNISMLMASFSEELQKEDLYFAVTLYGDTYYRSRPYDVKKIGNYADEVLIMAYDFHKSRGEPGPNFPFSGQKKYGYDFQQMIIDFSHDVSVKKLTVIFGKFGYDWTLGSQGMPLTGATAFTSAEAEDGFVSNCSYNKCTVSRDSESKEMKGSYVDKEGYKHAIWFEDEESVKVKTEYLKEQGIGSISYWTWGYW
ncbi:MAG TPA: glycosyl hydrolase family 18 protein [Candidatus Woesebacteria bacterium]|nr:glycosyl hydrolase family 18 protein [Candidatus Woesebacteria bacterium]